MNKTKRIYFVITNPINCVIKNYINSKKRIKFVFKFI